jgi:Protein of unknown function (DUF3761)
MITRLIPAVAALMTSASLFVGVGQATAENATLSAASVVAAGTCGHNYYKNVAGRCVHRPSNNPVGATARCRDGTYSYSQHPQGTCSYHGGVARWIRYP